MKVTEPISSRVVFVIVCSLVVLSELTIDLYLPAFSLIAKNYQTNINHVQWTLSLFFLGFGLSPLLIGPLSDYYGRRKILIVLLIFFIFSNFMIVFSNSIGSFIFWRFISGLSACFASVLATAIIRDIYSGNELARSFSIISMLWSVVPSVAPVIGGYIILYLSWNFSFLLVAIITSFLLIHILFYFPETMSANSKSQRIDFSAYKVLFARRDFVFMVLITASMYSIFSSYITFAPVFLATHFQLDSVAIGWMQLVFAVSYVSGNIINTWLLKICSISKIAKLGSLLLMIAVIVYFLATIFAPNSLMIFMLSVILVAVPLALIFANYCALSMADIPETSIASAGAILGSIQMLTCFVASGIIALMPDDNQVYFGVVLIACVCFYLLLSQALRKNTIA